ncbi:unnamed protein product [Cunninghamella blakesleeana]
MTSILNSTTASNDINSKDLITNEYKKSRYSMPGDWVEFSYYDQENQQYEDISQVFVNHYHWKPSQDKIAELKKSIEIIHHHNETDTIKDDHLYHKQIKDDEMDDENKDENENENKDEQQEERVDIKMDLSSSLSSSNNISAEKKRKLTDVNQKVILEKDDDRDQCNDDKNGMDDDVKEKFAKDDDHKNTEVKKEKMIKDINKSISMEDNTNKTDDDFDVLEDINTGNTTTSIESNQNIEDDWEIL